MDDRLVGAHNLLDLDNRTGLSCKGEMTTNKY